MIRLARLLLVLSVLTPAGASAQQGEPLSVAIAARLGSDDRAVSGRPLDLAAVRRVYAGRESRPLWLDTDGKPAPSVAPVLELLRAAGAEGLSAAEYHADILAAALPDADTAEERVALDLLLTDAVMKYAAHLRAGRLPPKTISPDYAEVKPPSIDAAALAVRAAGTADPRAVLAEAMPVRPEYAPLRAALARFRALEAAGGWPAVPAFRVAKLEPGMRDPAVPALRRRLATTGELEGDATVPADLYDAALRAAVERFQARHGLLADGVIGAGTLAALNVSVGERIGQIVGSLERLRWMPDDFGPRHIVVNIPDYALKAVEDGALVQDMRVIVGTRARRTPVLSSVIGSLILNPTWTMPVKLAKEDYLPKLLKDPGYLESHGIAVFASWSADAPQVDTREIDWQSLGGGIGKLRLRQDAGPGNALGRVKFNIANDFDVYLHDTPERWKFEKSMRALSSGCVRVGKPMELADFVLAGTTEWPPERRQRQIDTRETKTVTVKRPVAVHIVYQTAWVDAAGTVQFREDVYGRDAEMLDAFARRSTALQRVAEVR
ncbi:MAG TPA: L,D-transpeptidase family protein [Azospirillum sp.]|nr:L,D-transpeptidase family protein [Azospirillum sp.]